MRILLSAFILVSILLSVLDANEEKRSPESYGVDSWSGFQERGNGRPKRPTDTPYYSTPSDTPSASGRNSTTTTTGKPTAQPNVTPTTPVNGTPTTPGYTTQTSDVPGPDIQLNGEKPNGSSSSSSSTQQNGEISANTTVPTGSNFSGVILIATVGGVFVVAFGLFAFVRRKKRQEITDTIVATSATAWEQQNGTYEKAVEKPVNQTYTVVRTYMPSLSDELDIQLGDKVTILEEYDDGWVQGINETRGGVKGVFPRHCVDMNTSTNNKRTSSVGAYTVVDLN